MLFSNRKVMLAIGLLYRKLSEISKNEGVLMAQISDVQAAVSKLASDVSQEISDATAKIAALVTEIPDPNQAAELQAVVVSLNNIDSAVTGFDASLSTATGTATGS